ncbi:MAG: ExbD/TolR family protein [Saprospiraceae bacterium]
MAEMQVAEKGGKGGKVRSKKLSTRVDLTPMVDLAFLLITFFMLTTTLSKPQIMPVVMPEKKLEDLEEFQATKESQVITLMLGANDKVYYYEGITDPKLDSTDYSAEGLRKVILDKKDRVRQLFPDKEKKDEKTGDTKKISQMNVIIKPTKDARYKNIVDAFDEMKICNVALYVLLDISKQEEEFIANPAAGLKFSVEEQAKAAVGQQ